MTGTEVYRVGWGWEVATTMPTCMIGIGMRLLGEKAGFLGVWWTSAEGYCYVRVGVPRHLIVFSLFVEPSRCVLDLKLDLLPFLVWSCDDAVMRVAFNPGSVPLVHHVTGVPLCPHVHVAKRAGLMCTICSGGELFLPLCFRASKLMILPGGNFDWCCRCRMGMCPVGDQQDVAYE